MAAQEGSAPEIIAQIPGNTGVTERRISPESIREHRQKAVRALMWLSATMKGWVEEYGQTNEEITKAVQERPINSKLKHYDDLLVLFVKLLEIDKASSAEQEELIADWMFVYETIKSSPDGEYFDTFQQLETDEEHIDSQDFIDELKAFKHDLMSPTGGNGIVAEYNSISHDSELIPLVETANQLNYNFLNVKRMLQGIIDKKVNKKTIITPDNAAQTISSLNRVLSAFNIESGGEITGEVPASEVWEYIRQTCLVLENKFGQLSITRENHLSQSEESKLVPLNKSIIFRLLLNTVSNAEKSNPEGHIVVTLASSAESIVIAVKDDGDGFPNEEPDAARIILDNPVKLYKVAEGKTSWKSATGTGSGLFGLSNLARKLHGELVTGNYYQADQRLGALIALIVPYKQW